MNLYGLRLSTILLIYSLRCDEKNEIKPWLEEQWCIPEANAEFVAKMEDILDVYQRPYDPLNPVGCIDETNKQLIEETLIPCAPSQSEKVDYEYERNGVADVFMIFEKHYIFALNDGSNLLQANSAMRITSIPFANIRSRSDCHRLSSQCSG